MESFVYVVLWLGLLYLKHNQEAELQWIFDEVFDDKQIMRGNGKHAMLMGRAHLSPDFTFLRNEPLTTWINLALDGGKIWLLSNALEEDWDQQALSRDHPEPATKPFLFGTHVEFRRMWTHILDTAPDHAWPTDELRDNPLQMPTPPYLPRIHMFTKFLNGVVVNPWYKYTMPGN